MRWAYTLSLPDRKRGRCYSLSSWVQGPVVFVPRLVPSGWHYAWPQRCRRINRWCRIDYFFPKNHIKFLLCARYCTRYFHICGLSETSEQYYVVCFKIFIETKTKAWSTSSNTRQTDEGCNLGTSETQEDSSVHSWITTGSEHKNHLTFW